jgi:hypothetical protein
MFDSTRAFADDAAGLLARGATDGSAEALAYEATDGADDDLIAMLAWDDDVRAALAGDGAEPDWSLDDLCQDGISAAERLAACLAGGGGAGVAVLLSSVDMAGLSDGERIDYLMAWERVKAWVEAQQHRVLAALAAADSSEEGWSRESVMAALRVSSVHAQSKLNAARVLNDDLPATAEALLTGQITARHAEVIIEACYPLEPADRARFEVMALARAGEQTVPELRRAVKRAVLRLDPVDAEQRHQNARADRHVRLCPAEDGMIELQALLPATDAQAVFTRIDAAARLLPRTDDRGRDQQRADLFVDAVLGGIPADSLPQLQGRRPSIQVTVALSTLLGLDDQPADLAGYGAITAEAARQLATDGSGAWRRLVTDPLTGNLLDYGRASYRPPQDLTDFVLARDGVCVFPTCNQPAYHCDLEHCRDWAHDGTTTPGNTAAVCRRHHACKHRTRWRYRITGEGTTWTSPTGHAYTSRPPQRWNAPEPEPHENGDRRWGQRLRARRREQAAKWLQTAELTRDRWIKIYRRTGISQTEANHRYDQLIEQHNEIAASRDDSANGGGGPADVAIDQLIEQHNEIAASTDDSANGGGGPAEVAIDQRAYYDSNDPPF